MWMSRFIVVVFFERPVVVETATLEVTKTKLMPRRTFSIQVSANTIDCWGIWFRELNRLKKMRFSPDRGGIGGGAHAGVCGISTKASWRAKVDIFLVERDFQVLKILQSKLWYFWHLQSSTQMLPQEKSRPARASARSETAAYADTWNQNLLPKDPHFTFKRSS